MVLKQHEFAITATNMNQFKLFALVTGHSNSHAPFLASWPIQLFSCPLARDQLVHLILCVSVSPFGSYVPFCNRPLPLPRPLSANCDLRAKFQPPRVKTVPLKRGKFFWTKQPTDRATSTAAHCS